ncbi:MAG: translational machinery protein [Reyranella sp.]|uniref:translational machinery protein n=1 Tax=Reyranella sp. TaxID=1929291 RepID=UPI00273068C1|nr:translational machinery protein [Reyranella sp.]MDP1966068.1 translational machinery protein [Reyranella sp.]MDP2374227.1 translational machinery protein [Reyranella sp.]
MMQHFHAIIWIDHHQAKVFRFNASDVDRDVIRPHDPTVHLHHKANTIGSGHAPVDKDYLRRITESVSGAGAIMIVGPANAKTELAAQIAAHAPSLSARVSTVEAADHPSDGELVALARKFFRANDRMKTPG